MMPQATAAPPGAASAIEPAIRNAQPALTGYIGLGVLIGCFAVARTGAGVSRAPRDFLAGLCSDVPGDGGLRCSCSTASTGSPMSAACAPLGNGHLSRETVRLLGDKSAGSPLQALRWS